MQGDGFAACKLLSLRTSCCLRKHVGFLKINIFLSVIETLTVFLAVLLLLMQRRRDTTNDCWLLGINLQS